MEHRIHQLWQRLFFAAPVGLLLPCNHIYNQYVFIDNSDETLQKFEKTARNMHSLSRYSRQNAINKEWIDEYLNEAHSQGLQSVRAHFNVMAWGEAMEELNPLLHLPKSKDKRLDIFNTYKI